MRNAAPAPNAIQPTDPPAMNAAAGVRITQGPAAVATSHSRVRRRLGGSTGRGMPQSPWSTGEGSSRCGRSAPVESGRISSSRARHSSIRVSQLRS